MTFYINVVFNEYVTFVVNCYIRSVTGLHYAVKVKVEATGSFRMFTEI